MERLLVVLVGILAALALPAVRTKQSKSNIMVIISNDQDDRLGSLWAQPFVKNVLSSQGLTLENHFATVAQCCLSRTSFLRGKAPHNTLITNKNSVFIF